MLFSNKVFPNSIAQSVEFSISYSRRQAIESPFDTIPIIFTLLSLIFNSRTCNAIRFYKPFWLGRVSWHLRLWEQRLNLCLGHMFQSTRRRRRYHESLLTLDEIRSDKWEPAFSRGGHYRPLEMLRGEGVGGGGGGGRRLERGGHGCLPALVCLLSPLWCAAQSTPPTKPY